jgi:hypothetical protein
MICYTTPDCLHGWTGVCHVTRTLRERGFDARFVAAASRRGTPGAALALCDPRAHSRKAVNLASSKSHQLGPMTRNSAASPFVRSCPRRQATRRSHNVADMQGGAHGANGPGGVPGRRPAVRTSTRPPHAAAARDAGGGAVRAPGAIAGGRAHTIRSGPSVGVQGVQPAGRAGGLAGRGGEPCRLGSRCRDRAGVVADDPSRACSLSPTPCGR